MAEVGFLGVIEILKQPAGRGKSGVKMVTAESGQIGGLKMFEEHDVETGVPVLSKIPLLKRLFSNRAQVRGQSNLLIMVKPTIIIQAEKEEELGVDNVGGY